MAHIFGKSIDDMGIRGQLRENLLQNAITSARYLLGKYLTYAQEEDFKGWLQTLGECTAEELDRCCTCLRMWVEQHLTQSILQNLIGQLRIVGVQITAGDARQMLGQYLSLKPENDTGEQFKMWLRTTMNLDENTSARCYSCLLQWIPPFTTKEMERFVHEQHVYGKTIDSMGINGQLRENLIQGGITSARKLLGLYLTSAQEEHFRSWLRSLSPNEAEKVDDCCTCLRMWVECQLMQGVLTGFIGNLQQRIPNIEITEGVARQMLGKYLSREPEETEEEFKMWLQTTMRFDRDMSARCYSCLLNWIPRFTTNEMEQFVQDQHIYGKSIDVMGIVGLLRENLLQNAITSARYLLGKYLTYAQEEDFKGWLQTLGPCEAEKLDDCCACLRMWVERHLTQSILQNLIGQLRIVGVQITAGDARQMLGQYLSLKPENNPGWTEEQFRMWLHTTMNLDENMSAQCYRGADSSV